MAVGPLSDVRLRLVECLDDALEFKRWLGERRPVLAFDTETTGLQFWNDRLRLVQFGDGMSGWAMSWGDWAGVVKETFRDYEGELVGHNAKFDLHFLETNGVAVRRDRVHDTQTQAHLINPTRRLGLKPLSDSLIDPKATLGQEALHDAMVKNKWTWATVPIELPAYWLYSALDCVLTARLDEIQRPQVMASYRDAYDLEMAVSLVIADMERRGFRFDSAYTRGKLDELDAYTDEARAYCQAAFGVNPTSTRQVTARLIEDGVPLKDKTPAGQWKLDESVIETFKGAHPLLDLVTSIRQAGKFARSYFQKILDVADGEYVHAEVRPLGARTGRMSVANPPLQQLPSGSPLVRDCFVPREGNLLITCDLDQVELRILAHFANEQKMIQAIHDGVDLHTFAAQQIFHTDTPTKAQRKQAKGGSFAKVYGAGPAKFALQQGITEAEARAFMSMYDAEFPGVPAFIREVETTARYRQATEGVAYVRTPVGRRLPLTEQDGNYVLVNHLIQSTAADLLKQKLVAADCAGLGEFLILPVHDELILDAPADIAHDVAQQIEQIMSDRENFAVPITAGAQVIDRWGSPYRGV